MIIHDKLYLITKQSSFQLLRVRYHQQESKSLIQKEILETSKKVFTFHFLFNEAYHACKTFPMQKLLSEELIKFKSCLKRKKTMEVEAEETVIRLKSINKKTYRIKSLDKNYITKIKKPVIQNPGRTASFHTTQLS